MLAKLFDRLSHKTQSIMFNERGDRFNVIDGLTHMPKIIHESKTAKYYKYANGVVEKVYKVKDQTLPTTKKVTVSNDADGDLLIKTLLKPLGIKRRLFRVPNDGQPYKAFGNFCRNGNIPKRRAKIIDVYLK